MSKMRVYEYAKQINVSSKEIINILKKLNVEVSNHMSMIEEEALAKVESYMNNLKQAAKDESNKPTHSPTVSQKPKDDYKANGRNQQDKQQASNTNHQQTDNGKKVDRPKSDRSHVVL